jgi:hypothetical protein
VIWLITALMVIAALGVILVGWALRELMAPPPYPPDPPLPTDDKE